jgi:hypothetical protein
MNQDTDINCNFLDYSFPSITSCSNLCLKKNLPLIQCFVKDWSGKEDALGNTILERDQTF